MNEDQVQEIKKMKEILKGELTLDKSLFWRDIIICILLTWPMLYFSALNKSLTAFFIGSFFLYKGTILIHEVSHLAKKIKGYRLVYNIFFGWPNGYPAYIYDTHLFHHGKKTYGTKRDPEYKYMEEIGFKDLLRPFLSALILPFFQLFRFAILPIFTPFLPRSAKIKIFQKFSTLVFSLEYTRTIRDEKSALQMMKRNDLICALYKFTFFALIISGILTIQFLYVWYGSLVFASILNMYRSLFNHRYSNKELTSMSWADHLRDTITIEPGPITNLVCVNGLNYHGIHHLFPELPYTNLKKAHQKLMQELPKEHIYRQTVVPSLFQAFKVSWH